jgi:preprotein translocase subunit SecA
MIGALARTIFGSSNDRMIKRMRRTVAEINSLEEKTKILSSDHIRSEFQAVKQRLQEDPSASLDDQLPWVFALVREAAQRSLGQRPFDVQLMGAIALHEGFIPEMRTGEGKTLTATLAVCLNALEGKGVHVVTVNDYLAKRDAGWMSPIYNMLGLSVGCITSNITDEARRAAYACDITYGTNNEFGFDYLRDNMKFRIEDMVQRPFHYAIVDEVDSILIDEARTPLIISGAAQDSAHVYQSIDRVIPRLSAEDYEIDEKHKTIVLTDRGNEHAEQIMRELGILEAGTLYDAHNIGLVHYLGQALRAHKMFRKDVDYIVKDDAVIIIDEFTGRMMEGRRYSEGLHQAIEAKERVKVQNENQTLASITFQNYFRMYPKLAGMTGTALTEKDEFETIYNLRVVEIPTNLPQIRKDHHDEIYRTATEKDQAITSLIEECRARQQPVLVGTVSIEKSERLSRLLHKKNIPHNVLNARYHEQEAFIIAQAGKPGAITIATNMAGRGTDIKLGGNVDMRLQQEIPADATPEQRAAAEKTIRAEIAEAYEIVKKAGGLYVIGSERHESRRIDNQLRGRSGRQGDPGASCFFISLEDDLMRIFGSERMDSFLKAMGLKEGQPIVHPWINAAIERAQKKVEAQHFEVRKSLLKFDNVMNDQRKVIYEQRREIMTTSDVSETVTGMRHELVENVVDMAVPRGSFTEQWDSALIKTECLRLFNLNISVEDWQKEDGMDAAVLRNRLIQLTDKIMQHKEQTFGATVLRQLEKGILLQLLDQLWKEHLLTLDYLRHGIQLRAYGQKDPLNEYKTEAFAMFQHMLASLREKVTETLTRIEVRADAPVIPQPRQEQRTILSRGPDPSARPTEAVARPFVIGQINKNDPGTWHATPRNAPCPCDSGKKYKYCHGKIE